MSAMRTYAPMKRQSVKVAKAQPDFRAVYKVVDQRSEGRCEANQWDGYPMMRCRRRASDHRHLYKPRRRHHDPALIVRLCRHHHGRCVWPYKRGRLVISLVGGCPVFAIRFAADKFALRSGATAG